jgi:hypothetical protein
MPEPPGPDDRLGFSLIASYSKLDSGYLGALVGVRSGRWEWECNHSPHVTMADAIDCAKAEIRGRRAKLR